MQNRPFWREFIRLYRDLPVLWEDNNIIHKNVALRQDAYRKLTEKFKEIDPTVDVSRVKNKIKAFRSIYRRELKKVLKSEAESTCLEDIYKPSIWYYNEFDFLSYREIRITKVWSMGKNNEETGMIDRMQPCPQEETLENTGNIYGTSPPVATSHQPPKKKRKMRNYNKKKNTDEHLQKSTSDNNIPAETYAIELNNLEPDQQLFAQNNNSVEIHSLDSPTPTPIYLLETTPYYLLKTPTQCYLYKVLDSNSTTTANITSGDSHDTSGELLSDPQL